MVAERPPASKDQSTRIRDIVLKRLKADSLSSDLDRHEAQNIFDYTSKEHPKLGREVAFKIEVHNPKTGRYQSATLRGNVVNLRLGDYSDKEHQLFAHITFVGKGRNPNEEDTMTFRAELDLIKLHLDFKLLTKEGVGLLESRELRP